MSASPISTAICKWLKLGAPSFSSVKLQLVYRVEGLDYEKLWEKLRRQPDVFGVLDGEEGILPFRLVVVNRRGEPHIVTVQVSHRGKVSIWTDSPELARRARMKLEEMIGGKWRLEKAQKVGAEPLKVGLLGTHALNIAAGLPALIRESSYREGLKPNPDYAEPALQHLHSGYPSLFELCKKMMELEAEMESEADKLRDAIREAPRFGDQLCHATQLLILTEDPGGLVRVERVGTESGISHVVKVGAYGIAEVGSPSRKFESEVRLLALRIENEVEELRGSCEICDGEFRREEAKDLEVAWSSLFSPRVRAYGTIM